MDCTRCGKIFKWKSSFVRHKQRKYPCRPKMFICTDCNKDFVSRQSLGKHKVMYCSKEIEQPQTPLSDILASLLEKENSPRQEDVPVNVPVNVPVDIPTCFGEIMVSWMNQLLALEGKMSFVASTETFNVIDRLLQEGLITTFDHGELYYTTRLFIRLQNMFDMGITSRLREEYTDILLALYEMKRIDRQTLIYMLVNV